MVSRKLRPDLAISDGLVVTPSTRPVSASSLRTAMSAVSTKSCMVGPGVRAVVRAANGGATPLPSSAQGPREVLLSPVGGEGPARLE